MLWFHLESGCFLTMLWSWGPTELLSLKQLSLKLVTLLALCQPKPISELAAFDLRIVEKSHSRWVFHLAHMMKTQKVGALPDRTIYANFPADPLLCPVVTLASYLARMPPVRGTSTSALFFSYRAPHKPISSQTISRWLTTSMATAGIDTSVFKAHSTQSASSSKAVATGFPISRVLEAGCWSDKSNTFAHFYHCTSTYASAFSGHLLRCSFEHAVWVKILEIMKYNGGFHELFRVKWDLSYTNNREDWNSDCIPTHTPPFVLLLTVSCFRHSAKK